MFNLIPWRTKSTTKNTNGGALAPVSPFAAIAQMRDEFDRLFDRFFQGWPTLWQGGPGWGMDLEETDEAVIVRAEAPGFEPEDFDLQVRGNQLVLRAARKAETDEKEQGFRQWHHQELYRTVTLPVGVNADRVEARYRNGVLTVTLPKTEESKGRRIPIKG